MRIPVEQGARTQVRMAPAVYNGTRTFNTITFISDVQNRSDVQFPFARNYGLEYLDFLANSTPVGQNVTVTIGAPRGGVAAHVQVSRSART